MVLRPLLGCPPRRGVGARSRVGARSPDRAPSSTGGLLLNSRETFGRDQGHGRKTVPQPRHAAGARSGARAPAPCPNAAAGAVSYFFFGAFCISESCLVSSL